MTHAHDRAYVGTSAGRPDAGAPGTPEAVDPCALRELDEALRGLRRLTMRPPEVSLTLPGTRRRIDFAKLLACAAIAALESDGPGDLDALDGSSEREPVTVKAVALALDLGHSTVSRVLSDAESDGLVQRSPHPHDRRSTVLSLTQQGRSIVEGFELARLHFIGVMLKDWSPDDVQSLARLLARLVDSAHANKQCWSDLEPHEAILQALSDQRSGPASSA